MKHLATAEKPRTVRVGFTKAVVDKFYHDGGILPLEVLVQTMRQAWREKDYALAREIAVQAAPYMHAKMAQLDVGLDEDTVQRVARLPEVSKNMDEWQRQYAPREPEVLPPLKNGNGHGNGGNGNGGGQW